MILKKKSLMMFAAAFLLAALMPLIGSAQSNDAKPASLLTQVDAKKVDRIDVLLIDGQTNFSSAVTQDVIERVYDVKYSVRNDHARALLALVNEQIAKAKEMTARQNYDIRYAVILFDDKDNRLLSLYIDNLSSNGLLGAKDVLFDSSFKKLLRDWHPTTNTLHTPNTPNIPDAPVVPFKYPPSRP